MNTKITPAGYVYADNFSQRTDKVKIQPSAVYALDFDETGEEGKVQIFSNGRIKAAFFSEIDGKLPPSASSATITFRIKSATPSSLETTIERTTAVADIAPSNTDWTNHGFLGWSKTEYPSYSAIQDRSAFVSNIDPNDGDAEIFAVYDTNFQGLIDEGFVTVAGDPIGLQGYPFIFVADNHYPEELVTDFHDVFYSVSSSAYVSKGDNPTVGAGSDPNVFGFWQEGHKNTHWLSTHRWKELFESRSLAHIPAASQFWNIDWSNEESISIKYNPNGGAVVSNHIFGESSPRKVYIDVGSSYFWYMNMTLGDTYGGCSAEEIHLTSSLDGGYVKIHPAAANLGYNATFEGCVNLKVLTGLDATGRDALGYIFDGCYSLETASIDLLGPSHTGMLGATTWLQAFGNCHNLTVVEPILVVTGSTETSRMFSGCEKLESVRIYGLNAATNDVVHGGDSRYPWNYTWDFTNTSLDQASVDYMIANAVTASVATNKTLGLPNGVTVTAQQISDMAAKGWDIYQNGQKL